jgi:hypothetical protein
MVEVYMITHEVSMLAEQLGFKLPGAVTSRCGVGELAVVDAGMSKGN